MKRRSVTTSDVWRWRLTFSKLDDSSLTRCGRPVGAFPRTPAPGTSATAQPTHYVRSIVAGSDTLDVTPLQASCCCCCCRRSASQTLSSPSFPSPPLPVLPALQITMVIRISVTSALDRDPENMIRRIWRVWRAGRRSCLLRTCNMLEPAVCGMDLWFPFHPIPEWQFTCTMQTSS